MKRGVSAMARYSPRSRARASSLDFSTPEYPHDSLGTCTPGGINAIPSTNVLSSPRPPGPSVLRRRLWVVVGLVVLGAVGGAAGAVVFMPAAKPPVDSVLLEAWRPIARLDANVLLSVATPPPSGGAQRASGSWHARVSGATGSRPSLPQAPPVGPWGSAWPAIHRQHLGDRASISPPVGLQTRSTCTSPT